MPLVVPWWKKKKMICSAHVIRYECKILYYCEISHFCVIFFTRLAETLVFTGLCILIANLVVIYFLYILPFKFK